MLKPFVKKPWEKPFSKVLYPNDETESGKELISPAVFLRFLFSAGYVSPFRSRTWKN